MRQKSICRRRPENNLWCVAHGSPFATHAQYCEVARKMPNVVRARKTIIIGFYRDWRWGFFSANQYGVSVAFWEGPRHTFWVGPICIEWT